MPHPTAFELAIEGMHCAACVRRVRAAVEKVPGVAIREVAIGSMMGTLDDTVTVDDVTAALGKAGYPATVRAPAGA